MLEVKKYQLFINGSWIDSQSGETDKVYNPTDESLVGVVQNGNEAYALLALQAAELAQKSWRDTPARFRPPGCEGYREDQLLHRITSLLRG